MAIATGGKIDWLYPELLSKEGLIEILSQRLVKLPEDTANTSRQDLVDLYYECVIPLPQRNYRHNRRGRDMAKKQILLSKKRKITGPDTYESPSKMKTTEPSRLLTSFEGQTSGDRLKPPPSCVDFDKKVIRLGGSRTSSESQSASTTASAPQTDNSSNSSVSATPRVIRLSRSSSGDASSNKSPPMGGAPQTVSLNKTIKLINSHLGGSGDVPIKKTQNCDAVEQPMETDDSPEPISEKKKFTKISWP